jgi:hypothetical protein
MAASMSVSSSTNLQKSFRSCCSLANWPYKAFQEGRSSWYQQRNFKTIYAYSHSMICWTIVAQPHVDAPNPGVFSMSIGPRLLWSSWTHKNWKFHLNTKHRIHTHLGDNCKKMSDLDE